MQRTESAERDRAPVLGGYRIEDRLGRGAMGAVYLATQTSLDRPVALKVLSPKLASDPASSSASRPRRARPPR